MAARKKKPAPRAKRKPPAAGLSPRQAAFVGEYLVDLNATAAAARAGYRQPNSQGPRLLVNVGVEAAIAAAMKDRSGRVGVTQDYVLTGLKAQAELAGEGSSHGARVQAYKLLGLHLGMFAQKHELTGAGGGPVRVQVEGYERLRKLPLDELLRAHRATLGVAAD